MKRKTITLVIYMLVCISLVSVGFAAWVITGGDNTQASGNVKASVVSDHSLTISNEQWIGHDIDDLDAGEIIFGKPSGNIVNTGKWLQAGDDVPVESLTDQFKFTISSASTLNISDAVGTVTFSYVEPSEISTAVNAGYLQEVQFTVSVSSSVYNTPNSSNNGSHTTSTELSKAELGDVIEDELGKCKSANEGTFVSEATITIGIIYKWGFGTDPKGTNPFTHYGNISEENMNTTASNLLGKNTENRTYKVQAKEALETISKADGTEISFTLEFDSKGAN